MSQEQKEENVLFDLTDSADEDEIEEQQEQQSFTVKEGYEETRDRFNHVVEKILINSEDSNHSFVFNDLSQKEEEYKIHEENLENYRSTVFNDVKGKLIEWTKSIKMENFELKKMFTKDEIKRQKVLDEISGKKNIAIIFITKTMHSFGIFESRPIIDLVQQSKMKDKIVYTKNSGKHFIFSLNNCENVPFVIKKKNKILHSEFLGLYNRNTVKMKFLKIKNFGWLGSKGEFGLCKEIKMNEMYQKDGWQFSRNEFFGDSYELNDEENATIQLDSILILQGIEKKN